MSYLLGFDFGMKCIGVAVGSALNPQAKPLQVIKANHGTPSWKTIDDLCAEWWVKGFVVGVADGEQVPQQFKKATLSFIYALKERYQLPVYLVDEHYTTQEARQRLQQMQSKQQRHDDIAAAIILESYFNQTREE